MDTQTLILVGAVAVVLIVVLALVIRRTPAPPPKRAPEESGRFSKTAGALGLTLRQAWGSGLNDSTWTRIEDGLLATDVGVAASSHIVAELRSSRPDTVDDARKTLAALLLSELVGSDRGLRLVNEPAIILVVGVNGTGKTTTIAKLAHRLNADNKTVLLGAADTFRAAAAEQLELWADRVGVDVVSGQEGGDAASVAFDAVSAAKAREVDVVIIDTAGRLHGKKNLMGELKKIHRVAAGEGAIDEVLLVLDATAGQNGLAQVREFAETVPVTGIVLTKLDGTAKGGIVIAVEKELEVPVKFIGLGEGVNDLEPFDPQSFVAALLEES